MRWIQHRKKDNKYRQWSTVVDQWATDWLTRDEMLAYIEKGWKQDLRDRIKKERKTFPGGWGDKSKPYSIHPYPKK